jgi:hypothetical protein
MSKALRTLIATVALGLMLVPAALADTATTDLVLARDACGGTDPANERLDLGPGASTGSCGDLGSWGGPTMTPHPAKAGVPITIDGTRNALIVIAAESYTGNPVGGIGDQTTTVELIGTTQTGKKVSIAKDSQVIPAADMLRKGSYVAEFNVPIVGGFYKGLTLNLTIGGSVLHSFVHYNGDSFLSLPVPDPV